MASPDFDFASASIYLDPESGWVLDRDWNQHPALAHEVERLYLAWLSLAHVVADLADLVTDGRLVAADNLDGLEHLSVNRFFELVHRLVTQPATLPDEGVDDAGAE